MREFGVDIELVRLDLSSVERGADRIVQFGGGELLVTSDAVDVRIDVSDGALRGTALLHGEDVQFDVTIIDDCIEVEIRERNEIVDLIRECASGDIEGFINDFLGGELLSEELPDFNIFARWTRLRSPPDSCPTGFC